MTDPIPATEEAQKALIGAILCLREAETAALTLDTNIDAEAVPHITRCFTDAHHAIRGAFYALSALANAATEELP